MEGLSYFTPVIPYISQALPDYKFTVVDIGCAGGIDGLWRRFEGRLQAFAVDPNAPDLARLQEAETHPGVKYVAAFAGLPQDHPLLLKKQGKGDWPRNPWNRLSAAKRLEVLRQRQEMSQQEQTSVNLWGYMDMTEVPTIILPDYLRENGVGSVDFIKIDVDGKDWEVLNSLDAALGDMEVLAMGVEVSYFGSGADTDNTFHNMDRFLKDRGFELFSLTVRRFSVSALPSRFTLPIPAQTEFGRIQQGDGIYVRDLASTEHREFAARLAPEKLANLICIYAAFNLPDCAAEIAVEFRDRLTALLDVDRVLDLLTEQALHGTGLSLSYRELLERFDAEDPMFWPAPPEPPAP